MKVEHQDGLLLASMQISFLGCSMTLSRLVIDTGAECTLISSDAVAELSIFLEDADEIVTTYGIGGPEYSMRKRIDAIRLDGLNLTDIPLDFGHMDYSDINGLIGLDVLMAGRFVIDLQNLEVYCKAS